MSNFTLLNNNKNNNSNNNYNLDLLNKTGQALPKYVPFISYTSKVGWILLAQFYNSGK